MHKTYAHRQVRRFLLEKDGEASYRHLYSPQGSTQDFFMTTGPSDIQPVGAAAATVSSSITDQTAIDPLGLVPTAGPQSSGAVNLLIKAMFPQGGAEAVAGGKAAPPVSQA